MSDVRETSDRTLTEQPVGTIKLEQVRNIPGGAMVRTLPTQQRFIMTPVQSSTALITSSTTLQAQVLPKVTVQGSTSRISAIPMQSTATSTTGYHVPKGPAAVANITVPRSTNVATPIVRGTSLQAVTMTPHSIPGSISTTASAMQIGRPVVSNVAPWIGVPSGQHNIPRQPTTQLRPAIQQISGTKTSNQVRPIDNQRMLVHSSTTHKQVITQQAQVQQLSTGSSEQPKGTTVLKSYGGANTSGRLVAPPAPGLSRITTIPSAMAVSLHSAAAVLVPNSQGIPVKTTVAPQKVITQPVHSTTSIQFPAVCSAAVQPTLALNTVQVSRPGKPPALVTVMLSPSVASSGTSGPTSVAHIKPHPASGGSNQLVPQNSSGSATSGMATVNKIYAADGTHAGTNQPVFIQTQGSLPSQITQKSQQLPGALILRESPRPKDDQGGGSAGVSIHSAGAVYSLASNAYYEGQSYLKVPQHLSTTASVSLPTASQPASLHIRQHTGQTPTNSSSSSHPNLGLRVNPIMVMETNRSHLQPFSCTADSSTNINNDNSSSLATLSLTSQALKQTTSPRPSILRKREPEGSPMKIAKNLNPALSSFSVTAVSPPPSSGSPPPKRPESGQSGQSSSGSTTISANSSPGESPNLNLKQEGLDDDIPQSLPSTNIVHPLVVSGVRSRAPPTSSYQSHSLLSSSSKQAEMSPRKKPRKQQLSGNQIVNEPTFSEDEMEFISEERIKKEIKVEPVEDSDKAAPKRTMSLLNSYKHNWKGRNNHFNRYTDVKPKEERKPTLSEIANQKNVLQKLTGWKIYHIATHLEDLANNETEFFSEYNTTLNFLEDKLGKCKNREIEKDFHRITERVKANFQRSRVVKDHMVEARAQLFKLLEHKSYISDIINRNAIKRPIKKRERV